MGPSEYEAWKGEGMELLLLRHAKSDWGTNAADLDRPLAKRGRRQAPEAGRWLAEHGPAIELAVVSPARRARETWELVAAELGSTPEARVDRRLYFDSPAEVLADLPAGVRAAVLVGHNPDLEDLVHRLTGEYAEMVTSAIAWIRLPEWTATSGELIAAGRPPD